MTYKEESYVLDNIKQIAKEIHENNIMLQHICSYIDNVLINRKNDEQNAFEQNVVAIPKNGMVSNINSIIQKGTLDVVQQYNVIDKVLFYNILLLMLKLK